MDGVSQASRVAILACVCFMLASGCGPSGASNRPPASESISAGAGEATAAPEESLENAVETIAQRIDAGKFVDAETLLRKCLATDPTNPQYLFLAARCSYQQRKLDQAIEFLDSIPADHPDAGFAAQGQAADWLMTAGRLPEAESRFKTLLERFGDVSAGHRRLAELFNSQGRRVEAVHHVQQLIRLGDVTERELLSLTTLSVPFHDEATEFSSGSRLHDVARAKQLFVQEHNQEALVLTQALRQAFPQSTTIAALEGRILNSEQADDELQRWSQSLPSGIEREPEYWATIGQWMLRLGQPESAIRGFCEAVALDSTDRVAYLRLAEAFERTGEHELAQAAVERQSLLAEAWQLAVNIGFNRDNRLQDIESLANKLDELDRPWEAVAWRFIAASERDELEQAMPELLARRAELAKELGSTEVNRFATLGIDKKDWPLPKLDAIDKARVSLQIADNTPRVELMFQNVAADVGIDFQYKNNRADSDAHIMMYQTAGGGIAIIDYDLDGWQDLYFTQAGGPPNDANGSESNRLYRNFHGESTSDVASHAGCDDRGYGQGVTAVDLNQDGFMDLVVANIGLNAIYTNQGDGTFTRQDIAGSDGWTTSIVCGDVDGDHLPEIVEINYIDDPKAFTAKCWGQGFDCTPRIFEQAQDRLLKRSEQGDWILARTSTGFDGTPNYGFAGILANVDDQAGNDLFIVNDTKSNHFWSSQPVSESTTYTLVNQAQLRGCASGTNGQEQGCMGIASGDFDRDGTLDLCVTNYWQQPTNLFLQRSPGYFIDYASQYGLTEPSRATVGFGIQASDFDRDGWLDLAVVNGHVFDPSENGTPEIPFRMTPQLFHGGPNGFNEDTPKSGPDTFWSTPTLGRTLALLDFNRDGRQDFVVNHLDAPIDLLLNETDGANWIRLELVGVQSEREAIGAKIVSIAGRAKWTSWVIGGDGYQCSNEPTVDIGVGSLALIPSVEVFWPSGLRQTFTDVAANQSYLVIENEDELLAR